MTEPVRGMDLVLVLRHKLLCMHVYKAGLTAMQIGLWRKTRTRTMPLTGSVVEQMMARFHNFSLAYKKVKVKFKKAKCVSNRCKDSFKWKKYFAFRCALVEVWENEKCCGNTNRRRVFPQLFRVVPNFHECFYNSICFLFLSENTATRIKKESNLLTLTIKM